MKEKLLKLDLEPKGQGHSKKQNNMQGNKIFHLFINRAGIHLATVVQLMSQTGYEWPTNKNRRRYTKVKNNQVNYHHCWNESKTTFNLQFWSMVI